MNIYDFNEDTSLAYLNGLEPLDSLFAQLEKDEKEWLDTCKKDVPEDEDPDIDGFLDLFWDGGKGDDARKKVKEQYMSRLGNEIAEMTHSELIDISSDVDLMQLYLTFRTTVSFDFDKANKHIQQWVNNTRLVFVDKVEWDWEQKEDKVEVYFWIPWRNE